MSKQIIFADEAKNKLFSGVQLVAKAVKTTLGPKGKNAIIDREYTTPLITNDGVTIAKEISSADPMINMGAKLVQEASIKTNEVAGDGTTTAVVLTESIIKNGLQHLALGSNYVDLNEGINKALNFVLSELDKASTKIETAEQIKQVASVSSGSNKIGELIASAMQQVGTNGIINLEDGTTATTELVITDGLEIDRGLLSPYMATDQNKITATLTNPNILIVEDKISSINQILGVLDECTKTSTALLIICNEIDSEVLASLVYNKLKGIINVAVIKSPAFGERRTQLLTDIAVLTNSTIINPSAGIGFEDALNGLGSCNKAVITTSTTTIIGGKFDPQKLQNKKDQLLAEIQKQETNFEKDQIKERLAKLSNGVALIKVGAVTELEAQEKKLRIEDAINASKSATIGGIIAGGGCTLLKIAEPLIKFANSLPEKQKAGALAVADSLYAPITQICENAGVNAGVVIDKINNSTEPNFGYDAKNNTFGNMINLGIIDPCLVTKSAITSACSVATTFLTTEVLICDTTTKSDPN